MKRIYRWVQAVFDLVIDAIADPTIGARLKAIMLLTLIVGSVVIVATGMLVLAFTIHPVAILFVPAVFAGMLGLIARSHT